MHSYQLILQRKSRNLSNYCNLRNNIEELSLLLLYTFSIVWSLGNSLAAKAWYSKPRTQPKLFCIDSLEVELIKDLFSEASRGVAISWILSQFSSSNSFYSTDEVIQIELGLPRSN